MASYKIFPLPASNSISCVTFSCWDHTAGPLTKCLWIHQSTAEPDPIKVKQLTRLSLKTEVTRDPGSTDIDCNMYCLIEPAICAVTYVFGATSKLKPGKTIYCWTFIYKLEQRTTYLQWSSILDTVIKQGICEYKVLLHKDFSAGNMTKSNTHLSDVVNDFVELFHRMDKARLVTIASKVQNTYFCDTKSTNDLLWRAVNSMMLTFGRVIVVGTSEKVRERVNKWVRTLSLMLPRVYWDRCFTCGLLNQPIIPNALIQGVLSAQDLMSNKGFLLTLYTTCDYPITVVDVSKAKVSRTSSYVFHCDHRLVVREKQMLELLYSSSRPSLPGVLEEAKQDISRSSDVSPVISSFRRQLYLIEPNGRLNYISQYMAYLHSKANAIIEHICPVLQTGGNKLPRTDLVKYQLMNKDDVDVILCIAEFLLPGIYNGVTDDSLDNKPNRVIEAL